MTERVEAYLVKNKSIARDDIADVWQTLEQLYVKRLWHQLTVELRKVICDDAFIKTIDLKDFYDNFINEFEHRINPLQLVEIVIPVAKSIFRKSTSFSVDIFKRTLLQKQAEFQKQCILILWQLLLTQKKKKN
ncbi:unnamed protein product [Gongylonema pulchrum]|uniref:RsbRD_N domain-containing protein n=1 Tax=Gongylonema pulchrum TaxID=637853 RepID=A0A183ESR6_9BILA|nr:unnamed protein product [Gongylonema pulchrum]